VHQRLYPYLGKSHTRQITLVVTLISSIPHRFLSSMMPHSVNNSTSTQAKMSRPSSTSTYSGNNAFPQQAGTTLLSPEKANGQLSPAHSQFSFASSPQSVQDIEHDSRNRAPSAAADEVGPLRPMTSRSRAQFYEDQFSYKDGMASSARDRVTKDAPIVAELRTNVIVSCYSAELHSFGKSLTRRRSKTNTPWSPTSRTTSRRAIRGQKPPS